jgi:hypothetical protein
MVRVVLIYGPTSPRLRADLSSLTGRLVSVRVVRGPSCLVPVIDNAGYICYAEARFLGHQNDAKQFTMIQQIGVNGPLHFLEDCILLADQIYPNRHPTVTPFTIYYTSINRKPENMRNRSIFIRLLSRCIGILGTYLFSCIRPQGK